MQWRQTSLSEIKSCYYGFYDREPIMIVILLVAYARQFRLLIPIFSEMKISVEKNVMINRIDVVYG